MSQGPLTFTVEQVEAIAEAAAKRALNSFFNSLDVDVKDSDSVRELRNDLNFLHEQRKGSIMVKATLKRSAVYLLYSAVVGAGYFAWDIFRDGLLAAIHK